jgi:hypothetical protein
LAGLVAVVFLAALGYATLRYNVFKGVPWADWPSYTLNKALAFTSLILVAAAVFRMRRPGLRTSAIMIAAGVLGLAHSLLSFALLTPLYYAKLFEAGKLTFAGGLSMTIGVAAAVVMDLGARRSALWTPGQRRTALALLAFAVGVHAALPNFAAWLTPNGWPGGMPPITLLSFLCGVAALTVRARRPHAGEQLP